MDKEAHGCMVCNNLQKQLFCHHCVKKRLADVRRFRMQIALIRGLLLEKLEEKLQNKVSSNRGSKFRVTITVSYIST